MTLSPDPVTAATPPTWCTPPRAQWPRPVSGSDYFTKEKSMSFVTTQPEALFAAAGNLHGVGEDVSAHNAAAASATTAVIPAAADEVSALTAAQFTAHAQMY